MAPQILTSKKREPVGPACGMVDICIDRAAASGSVLLTGQTKRGRRFLRRSSSALWNGQAAFLSPGAADDLLACAKGLGLVIDD